MARFVTGLAAVAAALLLILAFASYSLTGFSVNLGVTVVEEPSLVQGEGNLTRLSVRILATTVALGGSNQTLPRNNVRVFVDGFRQLTQRDGFAHFSVAQGVHEVSVQFVAPTPPAWALWREQIAINTTTLLLVEFVDQVVVPTRAELLTDSGLGQALVRLDVNATAPAPAYATDLEVFALGAGEFTPTVVHATRDGPPLALGLSTVDFEVPAPLIWAGDPQVHMRYTRALVVEVAEQ